MPKLRRIDVSVTEVSEEHAAIAVEAIGEGRVVILPTETVYGFAADPAREDAIERIRELKRRPKELRLTHHVADVETAVRLAARLPRGVDRLLDRFWPGPLTVILPGESGDSVGVRWPDCAFTERIIREFGSSLCLTSVNRSGEPAMTDPDDIAARYGDDCDLFFDAGEPAFARDSTVLSCLDPELRVLRPGPLAREELLRTAAELVLFVCTGNTCRSPLAEVAARRAVADALGTTDDAVLARGLWLASAGIAAFAGSRASEGSREAAEEGGIDLSEHRSTPITGGLVRRAAKIYCLSQSHLSAIERFGPAAEIELLDPSGDIPDPFGAALEVYRRTFARIGDAVRARVPELLALCRG